VSSFAAAGVVIRPILSDVRRSRQPRTIGGVRLSDAYDELRRADARGDEARAGELFHGIVGLRPSDRAFPPGSATPPRTALFRHDQPRAIDLLALRRGARDLIKVEDLTFDAAAALERRLRAEGFSVVRGGPYARRFDVALTAFGPPSHWDVVASRGDLAERFVEAERDRTADGARRAGALLGYPRCCVEHFVALERSAEAQRDGVNEAQLRAFADGAATIPWELDPLSQHAPVGFAACSPRCPEALAFARRMLAVLDDEARATVRRVLTRPLLVLRLPLMWVFDGARFEDGWLRYERVAVHDHGSHGALQAWGARTIGAALAASSRLRLDGERLLIDGGLHQARAQGAFEWALDEPRVPRLLRFDEADAQAGA
jgi:hypothetical protein